MFQIVIKSKGRIYLLTTHYLLSSGDAIWGNGRENLQPTGEDHHDVLWQRKNAQSDLWHSVKQSTAGLCAPNTLETLGSPYSFTLKPGLSPPGVDDFPFSQSFLSIEDNPPPPHPISGIFRVWRLRLPHRPSGLRCGRKGRPHEQACEAGQVSPPTTEDY